MTEPSATASRYLPQLDGVRAFAVGLVVLSHWWPTQGPALVGPIGAVGVIAFFVLSGFLITGILLQERPAPGAGVGAGFTVLGRFYARRTLRIFPAYYLLLALLWIAAVPDYREDIAWYLAYASNMLFFQAQHWVGPAPHFWSLAVEEQFYLVWPLLVLFVPRRHLGTLILAAVACGPLSRGLLFAASDGSARAADFVEVPVSSCLDCLGMGAWLAWCRVQGRVGWLRHPAWYAFVLANLASLWWFRHSATMACVLLFKFNASVASLALVAGASTGFGGLAGWLLGNPVARYLGRISYGLYLYHLFIPKLYAWLELPAYHPWVQGLGYLALLLAITTLSWFGFERPLNRLKERWHPPPQPRFVVK